MIAFPANSRLIFVAALLWLLPAGYCLALDTDAVRFDAGQVSLDIHETELRAVLQELAVQAAFKLWMPEGLGSERISVRIDRKPLEKALRRLLAESNYALVFGDDRSISAVYVLPAGEEQSVLPEQRQEPVEMRQQLIQGILASDSIPNDIKTRLIGQLSNDLAETDRSQMLPSSAELESIQRLLEQIGTASPEEAQQLIRDLQSGSTPLPQ